ncbi:MAG: glycosyl transferase family 2 [Proteobacteria bacterium]|nr:glycosyl transferase family 2 [Pseudomonadota bacterium]MBU1612757.1 glycosyl transferase family 2 [Pseudomonadota bacterium]
MNATTLYRYTAEVLSFAFAGATPPGPPASPDPETLEKNLERTRRIFDKSSATTLVLFGLGSGDLASGLAKSLQEGERLIVVDLDPARTRAILENGGLQWWNAENPQASLIADTSPWALVYLLCQSGVTQLSCCMALNPENGDTENDQLKTLQRIFRVGRNKSAINGTPLGHFAVQSPSLSAAAILSPSEPDLDRFFDQFPDWVEELVILWDAEELPNIPVNAACPVRQLAHPLGLDFAAQRNRLLAACEADWVLMLDADEDFPSDIWTILPGLMPLRDIDGFWFQRQTFYPDTDHYRIGYGLWPDLQLRLFKNTPGLTFTGAIHERLTGITGKVGLVLDAPIRHHTFTSKRPEDIKAKLAGFDQAASGAISHVLSGDYPHLPNSHLHQAHLLWNEFQLLILPENPV